MLKKALFSFAVSTIFFPAMSFAVGERCAGALDPATAAALGTAVAKVPEKTEISPAMFAQVDPFALNFVASVDAKLLAGERLPNWSDFDKLEKLQAAWQHLSSTDPQFLVQYIQQQGPQYLFAKPQMAAIAQALQAGLQKTKYVPSEYGLRKAYFIKLAALKDFFPSDVQAQLENLVPDSREVDLRTQGAEFLTKSEAVFLERFQRVTGMTFEAYEAKLRASTDPFVQKAIAIIDADQVEIVMRRPENGRFWIPKVGFQNQFVTGSSRGNLNAVARNTAEALLYGVNTVADYSSQDAEFKPKYGTLKLNPTSGVTNDLSSSARYGPDFYTFRKSDIVDRLSFFPDDSLRYGMHGSVNGSAITGGFIPWKFRVLMATMMVSQLKKNLFQSGANYATAPLAHSAVLAEYYWESQILGPVSLDNVESFEFTTTPPSGEFLQELQQHGITIYDGRNSPAVKWTP